MAVRGFSVFSAYNSTDKNIDRRPYVSKEKREGVIHKNVNADKTRIFTNGERALKSFHYNSHYNLPLKSSGIVKVKEEENKRKKRYSITEIDNDKDGGEGGVCVGDNGIAYKVPGAPFEFQFSYSETPKMKPVALREPPYVPFGPTTMPRPWTGGSPLAQGKKKTRNMFPEPQKQGVPRFQQPVLDGTNATRINRDQILGNPLSKEEIKGLVNPCLRSNRQVNLGRDGFTHNMLELIHEHWRRRSVCKIKCKGVPTVDMDNVCYHIEDKTGGKIIYRAGGTVYLFRGRNYNHKTRPRLPLMLWKPAAPVYPKLIEPAPAGLTESEADEMRRKGQDIGIWCNWSKGVILMTQQALHNLTKTEFLNAIKIHKSAKNGVYVDLVKDVREAFEVSELVRINCNGLDPSDYKKIGAKLRDLVPCVLLSFDNEHILMWRGKDWKSMWDF